MQFTYPGVYVIEESSGVHTISGVATSNAVFIGWAPKGPTDEVVEVTSFLDFVRTFGALVSNDEVYLGHAVSQFFDNGGQIAYIMRIVDATAKKAGVTAGGIKFEATGQGDWAHAYAVTVELRQNVTPPRFRVDVSFLQKVDNGVNQILVERFENLSINPNDARYVKRVIDEQSEIVNVASPPTSVSNANQAKLAGGVLGKPLGPDDPAFSSMLDANFEPFLDQVDLFNLLCIPGCAYSNSALAGKLLQYCLNRRAMMIIDAEKEAKINTLKKDGVPGALTVDAAKNAAFYYPWIRASDPTREGLLRDFPPCGYVAGIMARTDSNRGVWKTPAGIEASLNGASEPKVKLNDVDNGELNVKAINCIRNFPNYGTVVWGGRTNHGQDERADEWKYTAVRRTALFLEESLYRGLKWVVFEPNDEPLWSQIRLNVGAFMHDLFRQGAFQGRSPREAYFVKCDKDTTTQNDINRGIVNIYVGFAPLKPAEFVVLHLQQIAGDIQT